MKTVLLPIKVPNSDYCWDYKGEICGRFDNDGGYATCDCFGMALERDGDKGVKKCEKCLLLSETNNTEEV